MTWFKKITVEWFYYKNAEYWLDSLPRWVVQPIKHKSSKRWTSSSSQNILFLCSTPIAMLDGSWFAMMATFHKNADRAVAAGATVCITLTLWPLEYIAAISQVYFATSFYKVIAWAFCEIAFSWIIHSFYSKTCHIDQRGLLSRCLVFHDKHIEFSNL